MLTYLKQSWRMMVAQPLYSSLYIGGVMLAIAAVMVLGMVILTKTAPSYPEYNRNRALYFEQIYLVKQDQGGRSGGICGIPMWGIKKWIEPSEALDYYTAYIPSGTSDVVEPVEKRVYPRPVFKTDANFFRMFGFDFLAGRPYTEKEVEAKVPHVVITASLASAVFGGIDEAIGKELEIDNHLYEVTGVVRDAPSTATDCFASLYIPYTHANWERSEIVQAETGWIPFYGQFQVVMLPKTGEGMSHKLREDIRSAVQRSSRSDLPPDWSIASPNQPYTLMARTFEVSPSVFGHNEEEEEQQPHEWMYYAMVALIILFVPALNLSGMIVARVDDRSAEMGIRKAFGAKTPGLVGQVLTENVLLTLIGAGFGLLLAWISVSSMRRWIFSVFGENSDPLPSIISSNGQDIVLAGETFFSVWVFLIAIAVALLLNVMSSLVPAWIALRRPIVDNLSLRR